MLLTAGLLGTPGDGHPVALTERLGQWRPTSPRPASKKVVPSRRSISGLGA
jgi:hypothetical protein